MLKLVPETLYFFYRPQTDVIKDSVELIKTKRNINVDRVCMGTTAFFHLRETLGIYPFHDSNEFKVNISFLSTMTPQIVEVVHDTKVPDNMMGLYRADELICIVEVNEQ